MSLRPFSVKHWSFGPVQRAVWTVWHGWVAIDSSGFPSSSRADTGGSVGQRTFLAERTQLPKGPSYLEGSRRPHRHRDATCSMRRGFGRSDSSPLKP
jgi:hypothetical protein